MHRPKNKLDLVSASKDGFLKLLSLIDQFDDIQRLAEFSFEHRDRRLSDVIWHLHIWHQMMLEWYSVGMAGEKPVMPAAGYSWKTLPALNHDIWQQAQNIDLNEALNQFNHSHQQVHNIIISHSDEELFTKKYYLWTGSTSLGSYLISNTSSHYEWARKLVAKQLRSLAITN